MGENSRTGFSKRQYSELLWEGKSDKKTGKTYSYSSMGFFSGNSLGDEPEPSMDNCVKKYNFEWGEVASKQDKYALQDGELSVLDAVTYTEGLFNKHMRSFEKEKVYL